ncbi:HD domain-containing protein [Belliella aquatica]|uniref:HD domain-containing protein n=1 Tax=Belliella aquatica TaxID=1323734 RepID=A0ABQ1LKI1_9BACT|nr:HD domain-containing protein [Belliella aquatica]MCH7404174.1 HD domain-containing protein [Belliella aquatica]GGC25903.1 hypothetical protein GCM10010993_01240 [Belliella aquatica]
MKNLEVLFKEKLDKLEKNTPLYLRYHNVHHTKHVLNSVEYIAKSENIEEKSLTLLKIAVLFHDLGFLIQRDGHEEISCQEAKRDLPAFDLDEDEVEIICGMIRATKTPQQPKNHLEMIVADADLEYLGTDLFELGSKLLFKEMKYFIPLLTEEEWRLMKIDFLESHHYHTDYCKKNRQPQKELNLKKLKEGSL